MTFFLTSPERAALSRVMKMLDLRLGGFLLSLLYGVLGLGSAIALSAVSAWLIARASQMPPVLYLSVAATAVRMFGVARALLRYMQRLASHKVALEGMDSLRLNVYDRVMRGPIDQVARLQRGDVLSRIGTDIDAVGDYVVKSLLPIATALVVGIGTVVGFAMLSIPAALVMAAGLLVSGVLAPALMARSAREAEATEQGAKRDMAVTALSILESADELAIDRQLDSAYHRLDTNLRDLNKARDRAARPAAFAAAIDRLAMGATVVGVLLVAIPQTNAGLVASVALAVLVLTPLAAFEGTMELGPATAQMIKSARAAERILDMLGPEEPGTSTDHGIEHSPDGIPELKATNLAVGWPERSVAVKGVNLTLRPGEVIAVVGPSGIGKSTLLYTLAGMLEPKSGSVALNGSELWRAQREQVTRLVSLTSEDAHIFATTVLENIRVARGDVTEEEATRLLNKVGLGGWIAGLPKGIHTLLGVGATTISGGERRRLLLARALATPAPLLLLDEPGEHLDADTADQVLRSLFDSAKSQRGLLIVTHRLSNLRDADQVIQLIPQGDDQPAIVGAHGSHGDLLESEKQYRWAKEQE